MPELDSLPGSYPVVSRELAGSYQGVNLVSRTLAVANPVVQSHILTVDLRRVEAALSLVRLPQPPEQARGGGFRVKWLEWMSRDEKLLTCDRAPRC